LLTFFALCVNVPILRTMFYVQVNLHVINLILVCLLFCDRNEFLSALALSLAVHLKASPVVLVLAFILSKQWRWLIYFAVITAAIAGVTIFLNGTEPYYQYYSNASGLLLPFRNSFRDNSIDNLLHAISIVLNLNPHVMVRWVQIAKLLLLVVGVWLTILSVRKRTYYSADRGNAVHNSYIPLLFLMTMLSPLVWEHHFVFVLLPVLVMLKKLDGPVDAALFGTAYFLIYLIPTFDVFPFSFNRLAGAALCYALMFRFLNPGERVGEWFDVLQNRMNGIFGSANAEGLRELPSKQA